MHQASGEEHAQEKLYLHASASTLFTSAPRCPTMPSSAQVGYLSTTPGHTVMPCPETRESARALPYGSAAGAGCARVDKRQTQPNRPPWPLVRSFELNFFVARAVLPELDAPGWTSDDFVRDMPVDFTLLLENLSDPDHGLFAHQTASFDSFAASAAHPMSVSTEPGPGGDKARRVLAS